MRFQVAVVGEFKRGKTSFINALLRKEILPADVVPATATINRITYGDLPSSYIHWNDGRPEEKIEIDQLSEIDLVIVTLDPNMPVSNTEARFIAQLVESDQICQIVFVVSKMDTVFSAQRERLLKLIGDRLQNLVREVLLETHDENDPVLKKYAELFTDPVIFPVSNTRALYAYEMGDQQALEDSGFQRLNEELLPLIIRTQHSAAVMTPLNVIARISGEFIQLLQDWEQRTIEDTLLWPTPPAG